MKTSRSVICLLALLMVSVVVFADEVIFEDGHNQIVREASTLDYIIHYVGDDGSIRTIRWISPTNINVLAKSRFRFTSESKIRYDYVIKNLADSRQPIVGVKIAVDNAMKDGLSSPGSWVIDVVKSYNEKSPGFWVVWTQYRTGLEPGQKLDGFAISRSELPGVGHVWLRGGSNMIGFPDEGPRGKIAEFLEGNFFFAHIDGASRHVAVPRIPNPTPFDAVTVLSGIRKHLDTDLVTMQLVDSTLVTELDRWLGAAISAAGRGNSKALRASLQEARKLLKREHEDIDKDDDNDNDEEKKTQAKPRIARLAARVLDFDLRYVENRIKGD